MPTYVVERQHVGGVGGEHPETTTTWTQDEHLASLSELAREQPGPGRVEGEVSGVDDLAPQQLGKRRGHLLLAG